MLFKLILTITVIYGFASSTPITKRDVNFAWGSEKVRGVNIGGWLVLEPWITPSIFEGLSSDIVDEYTLGEKLGAEAALKILRPHWDTWTTFSDFQKIKDSGFNLVRIPIGYWAYDTFGSPYVQGAAPYIDAAIDWARALGLKILIDLHGAPGSQNAFDNSGQRLSNPTWQTGDTVSQTLAVLSTITTKYASPQYADVIVAIEFLNEPLGPSLSVDTIRSFYRDAFTQLRNTSGSTLAVLHDAFQPPVSWNNFLTPSDNNAQNVAIDHHEYQVFTAPLLSMTPIQHRQQVCTGADAYSHADKWTIVGEWTGAMTDCARHLNGRGVGARFDGTFPASTSIGDCSWRSNVALWDQQYRDDTRAYIEAQMMAFETRTQGWVWWDFKTEGAHEWDAFKLIDEGIFPQPLGDIKFGGVC
ncbi:glycoside hydrolase family 5 protein [Periconia macrospinosa]|uniref:glucan 1,3-beta-glucosidase n=1 Tax=Periconia macrospinosa TaxID=97972 RepID=A0A2V1DXR0_9PLEO|nr:glycoside hydrolase family 5 protein [Periconia macrospinosa]